MASKEFLQERIRKAEEQINKKRNTITKKINLISKKEDQIRKLGFIPSEVMDLGWSRYDEKQNKAYELADGIEWLEADLENLHKAVEELQGKLQKYEADLQVIIEKENSRNIKVILDFLQNWKEEATGFYLNSVQDWIRTFEDYYKEDHILTDWYNSREGFVGRKNKELLKQMKAPVEEAKRLHQKYSFLDPYMEGHHDYHLNMEKLQKDLQQEADRKYDFIIERTNVIVGTITDASNLQVGEKGDLNGYIIGTKGTAKVQTIGAGGYNIQCFHFRTLINEMK